MGTWQRGNSNPDLIDSNVDLVFQEPPKRVQLDIILTDILAEKSGLQQVHLLYFPPDWCARLVQSALVGAERVFHDLIINMLE